ncbi:MerR family transcriptional regulator [Halodurantibacterium flavum]|uniref:MerR family transcriptional regulator n=1 Tax=Halodurantibacterium flavum TaxID=1382802 RepID=A0ABW4SAG0_9RHOB
MEKSRNAFRTISEVADWLDTPTHVLRFWESKFPEIRPLKRAGGRRYYRPADIALIAGIKKLLHEDGMTIRGVQKVLGEQGVRHVASLAGTPRADDAWPGTADEGAGEDEAPMILDAEEEDTRLAQGNVVALPTRGRISSPAESKEERLVARLRRLRGKPLADADAMAVLRDRLRGLRTRLQDGLPG